MGSGSGAKTHQKERHCDDPHEPSAVFFGDTNIAKIMC